MPSSLAFQADLFPRSSAPSQAQISSEEGGQPTKRRRNTSFRNPSSQRTTNTISDPLTLARPNGAVPTSEEDMFSQFQIPNSAESQGFSTSSHDYLASPDGASSIDRAIAEPHRREGSSSATSLGSAPHKNSRTTSNVAKAGKAVFLMPTQEAFPENAGASNQQRLELLEMFFTSYHPLLPCIHRNTFVERVNRGGSTESDALLCATLAVAASAHPDDHLRYLQNSWLSRARLLFDKDINGSTFPTRSLQAAVWIIFNAYISGDLTEAWFMLGKACRLAHLLGFDRIDCSRSDRFISMVPGPRDAIELEERRKTIWVLFFLDRSLSCLGGFSLAIDDRVFHVNYPVDDMHFQSLTHGVSVVITFFVRSSHDFRYFSSIGSSIIRSRPLYLLLCRSPRKSPTSACLAYTD